MSRLDDLEDDLQQQLADYEREPHAAATEADRIDAEAYHMGLQTALHNVHRYMAEWQYEVRVLPAFDCLQVQPCQKGSLECGTVHGRSHGRGPAVMEFAAYNPAVEVRLVLDTGWHHPATPEHLHTPAESWIGHVVYHTDGPFHGAIGPVNDPDRCPRGWEHCYSQIDFGAAPEGAGLLVTGGTDALWPWLTDRYDQYMEPDSPGGLDRFRKATG